MPAPPSALRALSHRSFLLFFIGVSIATTGQFMQSLAVPFYVNELTDSNAWVGASAFAVLVPSLLMTPVAGIWSDRISRKAICSGRSGFSSFAQRPSWCCTAPTRSHRGSSSGSKWW